MGQEKKGRVYWITGLSGAGKTTIGKELYQRLSKTQDNIVYLDGDILREVFGNDLGYTKNDRKICAMRYARMCQMLSEQGIDIIICTISMFREVREWNRNNITDYIEIYVEVSKDELIRRNQKALYSDVKCGETQNVVGMDLQLELPERPDIIIQNDTMENPQTIVGKILTEIQ